MKELPILVLLLLAGLHYSYAQILHVEPRGTIEEYILTDIKCLDSGDICYFDVENQQIKISKDLTQSWDSLDVPIDLIRDEVYNLKDKTLVLKSLSDKHIYVQNEDGWNELNYNEDVIAFDHLNIVDDEIFLATKQALYYSSDKGKTLIQLMNFDSLSIIDLEVSTERILLSIINKNGKYKTRVYDRSLLLLSELTFGNYYVNGKTVYKKSFNGIYSEFSEAKHDDWFSFSLINRSENEITKINFINNFVYLSFAGNVNTLRVNLLTGEKQEIKLPEYKYVKRFGDKYCIQNRSNLVIYDDENLENYSIVIPKLAWAETVSKWITKIDNNGIIYAQTKDLLYQSLDGGYNFSRLPFAFVSSFDISKEGLLYIISNRNC